jgi:hypothetical protein
VDDRRPTLIDRAKGKTSPGLYMRDIAEVRGGDFSYDFQKNVSRPANADLCLSLIGSERTISLELPGKMERDWFLERLQLVAQVTFHHTPPPHPAPTAPSRPPRSYMCVCRIF